MTKIEKYQKIIVAYFEQYATYKPVNIKKCENQVIIDYKGNHFQLVRIGWDNDDDFIYHTVFHFDIKPDGKIWIQVNWTDLDIAQQLVEFGVEKMDIVIGFQPERNRQYTGYAVA